MRGYTLERSNSLLVFASLLLKFNRHETWWNAKVFLADWKKIKKTFRLIK